MAAIIINNRVPFGLVDPLRVEGFPEGRVKIRIRPGEFVRIFIKTQNGIREFYPKEENGKWVPNIEKARNHRP